MKEGKRCIGGRLRKRVEGDRIGNVIMAQKMEVVTVQRVGTTGQGLG